MIERSFAEGLRHAEKLGGRGFQRRIAERTGILPTGINAIIKSDKGVPEGRRRDIHLAILAILPNFPAKTYDDFLSLGRWLLDKKEPDEWRPSSKIVPMGRFDVAVPGALFDTPPPVTESSNITPGPTPFRIPVISWVRAGQWSEAVDPFHPGDAEDWIFTTATNHQNAFALVVRGDSMQPLFLEGETIIVDPGKEWTNGSYVIAKNGDGEVTFKQLFIDGKNTYLRPLNTALYKQWDMTGIEFKIIGVVVQKLMKI